MSGPLPVRMPTGGPTATIAAAVLASLPLSYAAAPDSAAPDSSNADSSTAIELVDGGTEWAAALAAAARAGAPGILLVEPAPVDLGPLGPALDRTTVVVDSVWAANPAVEPAAELVRAALAAGTLVECRAVVSTEHDAGRALLAQLTLVRRLAGPVTGLTIRHRDEHGYLADGAIGEASIEFTLTRTNALAEHATVRILTSDGGVAIRLPSADTAQPAEVHQVGPDGDRQLPTLYESAHRASWRRVHRLLAAGESATDLADLTADLATLNAAVGPPV